MSFSSLFKTVSSLGSAISTGFSRVSSSIQGQLGPRTLEPLEAMDYLELCGSELSEEVILRRAATINNSIKELLESSSLQKTSFKDLKTIKDKEIKDFYSLSMEHNLHLKGYIESIVNRLKENLAAQKELHWVSAQVQGHYSAEINPDRTSRVIQRNKKVQENVSPQVLDKALHIQERKIRIQQLEQANQVFIEQYREFDATEDTSLCPFESFKKAIEDLEKVMQPLKFQGKEDKEQEIKRAKICFTNKRETEILNQTTQLEEKLALIERRILRHFQNGQDSYYSLQNTKSELPNVFDSELFLTGFVALPENIATNIETFNKKRDSLLQDIESLEALEAAFESGSFENLPVEELSRLNRQFSDLNTHLQNIALEKVKTDSSYKKAIRTRIKKDKELQQCLPCLFLKLSLKARILNFFRSFLSLFRSCNKPA